MYKRLRLLLNLVVVLSLTLIPTTGVFAAIEPPEKMPAASTVEKLSPVAIGALPMSGMHLVPPQQRVLEDWVGASLPIDATEEEVKAALKEYEIAFNKQSDTWISPEVQEWVSAREEALAEPSRAPMAIQPVTATVFAMAVDFGGTDTITHVVEGITTTVTMTGPLKGQIPHPGSEDNNTIWYSPTTTADVSFYEDLIFGYEGAGRTRFDLTDPYDGLPGIDLSGYTVQDYYDNVAGDGNVYITGTVEGWVTVPHSEAYYGAPGTGHDGGAGVPVAQLVIDAVDQFKAANPDFDWAKYDGNDDGVLDTFWVIHAGVGQEAGGGAQGEYSIWSHSSDLRYYANWEEGYEVADGIVIGPYTMQPEHAETGVFSEEFGHNFFGFPDLYTTDIDNSVGFWNIMSGGAWGGWLGGSTPAGMPLWFRMIAICGVDAEDNPVFCNWQEPMARRDYDDPGEDITIGQLEKTQAGVNKGIRVDLPNIEESIPNSAGDGNGAYTGSGRDEMDLRLTRQVEIPAGATGILTFTSVSIIEEDWDYGYVMVNGTHIDDMDGMLVDTYNPNGNNLGYGLTGFYDGQLRFDLSAYAGQTISLTLRYKTDAAVTEAGWWVDDLSLDGALLDDFSGATAPGTFPGWTNSDPGWYVVPTVESYANYYLVEWRAETKYDKMVETAYITELSDEELGWRVARVPHNIPGGLVYYRNAKYGSTYSLAPSLYDPPAAGPKYQLLVVDMNPEPLYFDYGGETWGIFSPRSGSYDAAMTLQPSKAFELTQVNMAGGPVTGTWSYPAKPAVTEFNDANGYYAGWGMDAPLCDPGYFCLYTYDSAVIPARGTYSTRLSTVDNEGNVVPYTPYYGYTLAGLPLGPGNPADDSLQYGVNFELVSADMVADDPYQSSAVFRFNNQVVVDVENAATPEIDLTGAGSYPVQYVTVLENTGTGIAESPALTYTLDSRLNIVSFTQEGLRGETNLMPIGTTIQTPERVGWEAMAMMPGDVVTLTLEMTIAVDLPLVGGMLASTVDFFDGLNSRSWDLETYLTAPMIYFVQPSYLITVTTPTTAAVPVKVATTLLSIPDDVYWTLEIDEMAATTEMSYTAAASPYSLGVGTHIMTATMVYDDGTKVGPMDVTAVTVQAHYIFLPIVMREFTPQSVILP